MQKRPIIMFLLAVLIVCLCYIHNRKEPIMDNQFENEVDCQVSGIIYQIVEKEKTTELYVKEVKILTLEGKSVKEKGYYCNKILVYYTVNKETLQVGSKILVNGTLQKFQVASNLGQFDQKSYYTNRGLSYKLIANQLEIEESVCMPLEKIIIQYKHFIKKIYSAIYNEKDLGVIGAMILGDKTSLDEGVKKLYQNSGISHILAISGLHISLIGMGFFTCIRKLRCPVIPACILTIVMGIIYGIFTDFSVSTKRAVIMLIIMLLGKILGRTYDMVIALSVSAIIILIEEPGMVYDVGFLLSFGAVLGVGVFNPILEKVFDFPNFQNKKKKNKKWFVSIMKNLKASILVNLSVSIITFPIVLNYFYEISIYSIIINIILVPMLSLLMFLAISSGILGSICIELGMFFAGGAHYILMFYEKVCELFNDGVVVIGKPKEWQIILFYIGLILFCIFYYLFQKRRYLIFLILLLPIFYRENPIGIETTFLDVGQGDGIVMQTKNGTTFLIDGGSSNIKNIGEYRLKPFLKAKGISKIDFVLLTHLDTDHISGVIELIEASGENGGIGIGTIILPETNLRDIEYLSLLSLVEKKNIKCMYFSRGDVIKEEKLLIKCLHPRKNYMAKSRNSYSIVLDVSYGCFQMLLTGDVEEDGEKEMLSENLLDNYDVLKVAHHGSKNSTSKEFLSRINPKISIISLAEGNRYGHPHRELLLRLKEVKSKSLQTKDSGAITIDSDGSIYTIKEYLK